MRRKDVWKVVIVVAVFIFAFPVAPEIGMLIALVDVVGIDLLLLLFEVQVAVLISSMYQQRIKPVLGCINAMCERLDPYYFVPKREQVKSCPATVVHAVPFLVGTTFFALAAVSIYA